MEIDFSLWLEKWEDELAAVKIESVTHLELSCRNLKVPPRVLIGACLQVAELEQSGSPSANRKARVKSIIENGVSPKHVKIALGRVSDAESKAVFIPPTEDEIMRGVAETKSCAREVLENIRKKRRGESIEDESN